ncbi:hypothetical protein AX17_004831 [Amanita inopinata Kibby_2008]|nr:hypothetical protein AX17_004831 [Amanita inopinata Kibby_2008]
MTHAEADRGVAQVLAEEEEERQSKMDAEQRAQRALAEAEKAKKSQANAELRARQAVAEARLVKRVEAVAERARQTQSNHPPTSRAVSVGLETTITRPLQNAKLPPKIQGKAHEEDCVTIQHLVLGSTLVTYGVGMDVQSTVCGFDNCFIEINNLPLDVQEKEIETLFTSADLSQEAFCVINTGQYGDGTINARAIVRREMGRSIADWVNGQRIRNNALKSRVARITPNRQSSQPSVLTITWEPMSPTQHTYSLRGSTSSHPANFGAFFLRKRLESMPGFKSFKLLPNHTRAANALFETSSFAKQAHDTLAGKRFGSDFPVIQCTLQPPTHAFYVPLQQYNNHERNGTAECDIHTVASGLEVRAAYLSKQPFDGWCWSWDPTTTEMLDRVQKESQVQVVERCWMTKALRLYAPSQ